MSYASNTKGYEGRSDIVVVMGDSGVVVVAGKRPGNREINGMISKPTNDLCSDATSSNLVRHWSRKDCKYPHSTNGLLLLNYSWLSLTICGCDIILVVSEHRLNVLWTNVNCVPVFWNRDLQKEEVFVQGGTSLNLMNVIWQLIALGPLDLRGLTEYILVRSWENDTFIIFFWLQ